MSKSPQRRARILQPIHYQDRSGIRAVAPIGAYDVAELGEHFQFLGEGMEPFEMTREHALAHHKAGRLVFEDWQS